jgi:preprotein translocase subunit SecG
MNRYVQIAELVVALLLILAILLQQRGAGLGGIFGGESNVYRTKRGLEKGLYIGTIILVILFLGLAMGNLLLQ